jgi:hypothetical protein
LGPNVFAILLVIKQRRIGDMEAFKVEMVAESVHVATGSTKKCVCGATLELIRSMLDSETGRVIHMYECKCGNRTWNEEFFDVTALKARAREK